MGNAATTCCAKDTDKMEASGDADVLTLTDEAIANKAKEPLTKLEIAIVEETWKKVEALGDEKVGTMLFTHIFKMAPDALEMFSFRKEPNVRQFNTPGFKVHVVKVVQTVGVAVGGLRQLDTIVPVLKELAMKHVGYGVQAAHYEVVGKALMQTLESGLKANFNHAARIAWAKVWHTISTTMKEAAATVPKTAAVKKPTVDPNGPLTKAEIKMVQDSWVSAEALGAEVVGVILFKNIFELAPDAKKLFSFKDESDLYESGKLKAHGLKVVNTVGVAVGKLEALDELVPILKELGLKHVGYGIQPAHYEVVGKALMKTLSMGLGPNLFKPDVEASWLKVYGIVQKTMISDNYK